MAIHDRRRPSRRALQRSAWRGDQHVTVLSPAPEQPTPTAAAVAAEVDQLRAEGVHRVLTSALHEAELRPFLASGFTEHERLLLLHHSLRSIPTTSHPVRVRRAWPRDQAAVLDIDARAFDGFWALDREGLGDAIRATPSSRYRVAGGRGAPVNGYAVTGRAADRGYLQRLAVDPAHHRSGVGRALVIDALTWLRRAGGRLAVVNTQERNVGALSLYQACGFVLQPVGLTVLTLDLVRTDTP